LKLAKENNVFVSGAWINLSQASKPVYFNEAGGIGIFSVGYLPDCVPASDEKPGAFSMTEHLFGNFIFDTDYQRAQFNTEKGAILKLILNENCFSIKSQGLLINRETGKITDCEVPDIFTNIREDEYKKLLPLSAKAFVKAEIFTCQNIKACDSIEIVENVSKLNDLMSFMFSDNL